MNYKKADKVRKESKVLINIFKDLFFSFCNNKYHIKKRMPLIKKHRKVIKSNKMKKILKIKEN